MESIPRIMAVCSLLSFLTGRMEKQYLREGNEVTKQMLTGILLSLHRFRRPTKEKAELKATKFSEVNITDHHNGGDHQKGP